MAYIDDVIKVRVLSDGLIYHYTTAQALHGILDNEQFWATKSDFLNDKSEFKYTYNLINENILINIKNETFRKKLVNAVKSQIDRCSPQIPSLSQMLSGYYIVSFSTNQDNLLLWSEFSNSMGYNLGFNINNLHQSFSKNIVFHHGEVIYDRDIQLCRLQEALNDSLTWRPECYCVKSINDFDEYTSDSTIDCLALDIYAFCTVYSMFFKQPEFANEQEYRFVLSTFHEENEHVHRTIKMHFRIKEDVLIPYIKASCKPINALQSITIGPKNNIDIAAAGIECYCREKRIDVPVKKSKIPLRY